MINLMIKQMKSMRFNWLPCVMLVLLTIRTFISGNSILLAGLCIVYLPYFTQIKALQHLDENIAKEKTIFSWYILYLLIIALGFLYIKGISYLGWRFYDGYVVNPLAHEMFLLAYLCDLAFISILLPLIHELSRIQLMVTGAVLANIAIAVMSLSHQLLLLSNGFVLHDQWGLYFLGAIMPIFSLGMVLVSAKKEKQAMNNAKIVED